MGLTRIGDVTLAYDTYGDPGGPRLVLVPGQGMSRELWQLTVLPALLDAGMHVLCYDQRGSGGSETTPGPYAVPALAADLVGLLDRLEWGPTAIAGVSLGGMVCEYVAATRPDLVTGAALIASTATATAFQRAYAAARSVAGEDEVHRILELLITVAPEDLRDDTQLARTSLSLLRRRGAYPPGFLWQGLAGDAWVADADRPALLQRIACPCLLMALEHDLLFPPHAVRQAAELVPGAEYHVVRDVAHGSALIKAADEIGEFLAAFFLNHRESGARHSRSALDRVP